MHVKIYELNGPWIVKHHAISLKRNSSMFNDAIMFYSVLI